MDKTVPAGAALLLDFIGNIEAPKGYNTVYGNNQSSLPVPVTKMTLAQIQAAQPHWSKRFGSSATGRYQFMQATLRDLIEELGLSRTQVLDGDLQDRLAYHLLKRRGYEAFMAGTISRTEFGRRLAQEWASLPVLANTKGGSRNVTRGQSFYAGDGLNKSLVLPSTVEAMLDRVKVAKPRPLVDEPVQSKPDQIVKPPQDQSPSANPSAAPAPAIKSFWSALIAAIAAFFKRG